MSVMSRYGLGRRTVRQAGLPQAAGVGDRQHFGRGLDGSLGHLNARHAGAGAGLGESRLS
jgi:hypothetical protein